MPRAMLSLLTPDVGHQAALAPSAWEMTATIVQPSVARRGRGRVTLCDGSLQERVKGCAGA